MSQSMDLHVSRIEGDEVDVTWIDSKRRETIIGTVFVTATNGDESLRFVAKASDWTVGDSIMVTFEKVEVGAET